MFFCWSVQNCTSGVGSRESRERVVGLTILRPTTNLQLLQQKFGVRQFFGNIPGMFVHWFQINLIFYVCQSVSWLTSLLKLDKYKDISRSELDIFLKFFGDIPMMFVHWFHINLNFLYVFQSVSWLTSLLKLEKYRDTSTS